jgi:hypothetical protein
MSSVTPTYVKPKFLKDYEYVYKEIYRKDLSGHKKSFELKDKNYIKDKLFELRFDMSSSISRSIFL